MSEQRRRIRERNRLRKKRRDPEYLAQEKAANADRMAALRAERHAAGLCWDCDSKPWRGVFCRACYRRHWGGFKQWAAK